MRLGEENITLGAERMDSWADNAFYYHTLWPYQRWVSRFVCKHQQTGHVGDRPRRGRPKTNMPKSIEELFSIPDETDLRVGGGRKYMMMCKTKFVDCQGKL